MKKEEAYFSADGFLEKLNTEITTPNDIVKLIETELQRVEGLKIRIVETNSKSNAGAMVRISQQIDSYIFQLQQILSEIPSQRFSKALFSEAELRELRSRVLDKINEAEKLS